MKDFALRDKALVLRAGDDVAVARERLPQGIVLAEEGYLITIQQDIPAGHKFALNAIKQDQPVRKYGQIIGFATANIAPGEHVHVHNVGMRNFQRDYAFAQETVPVRAYTPEQIPTFMGYRRADGRVGTRNTIAVISTVNCSAGVSHYVAEQFRGEVLNDYPNLDGIVAFTHKGGCGMKGAGEGYEQLQRVLAGFARHPNVAAYLLIGLGCEVNQAVGLIENQGLLAPQTASRPPKIITIQSCGGTSKAVQAAVGAIQEMLPEVNALQRTEVPISEIILATECGGSDANSGITANPAVGAAVDELVRYGGTAILAETPEMYGAEHLLTRRARNRAVAEQLIDRIRWWEHYTHLHGAEINNNPAPGNIEGGLTTIYEKSLGAIAKGGTTPLNAVYRYAEPVTEKGLVIMDTPGFDPPSVTGMVAGGANLVVFTTGCGSVFGCKPVPSLKIASNSRLYHQMIDDMDINAGVILEGTPIAEVGRQILAEIIAVASGKKTKSEQHGLGEAEFNPWMIYATL